MSGVRGEKRGTGNFGHCEPAELAKQSHPRSVSRDQRETISLRGRVGASVSALAGPRNDSNRRTAEPPSRRAPHSRLRLTILPRPVHRRLGPAWTLHAEGSLVAKGVLRTRAVYRVGRTGPALLGGIGSISRGVGWSAASPVSLSTAGEQSQEKQRDWESDCMHGRFSHGFRVMTYSIVCRLPSNTAGQSLGTTVWLTPILIVKLPCLVLTVRVS